MSNFVISHFPLIKYLSYLLIPVIEIVLLAVVFYLTLNYLKGTRSSSILGIAIFSLIVVTILADILSLEVIEWILNSIWTFLPIAIVVVFQPEIRRVFTQLSNPFTSAIKREEAISEISTAVANLSAKKHGALIAIEQNFALRGFCSDYVKIDATLTHELLETVFMPNTQLHDGAVIVRKGRLKAAGCILPLSSNDELTAGMGTRHRAALGITEETDALVIVVSEETGIISIAYKGNIKRGISSDKARRYLDWLVDETKPFTFKDILEDEKNENDENQSLGS
ncbi:MAG TPA: TIGR00159 family protein [Lentisphaeria bacterium]|nr:MAG: TIGR00159 family protein [Lentisphaerae bacterium GWF2_38_69]HBM16024.1 TIGR00159 family protein [Lentisphaeria bacterium]